MDARKLLAIASHAMAFFLCWLSSEFLFMGIWIWLIPGVPDSGSMPLFAFPYFSFTYHSGNLSLFHDATFTFCGIASCFLVVLPAFAATALRRSWLIPAVYFIGGVLGGVVIRLIDRPNEWLATPTFEFGHMFVDIAFYVALGLIAIGVGLGLIVRPAGTPRVIGFDVVDARR